MKTSNYKSFAVIFVMLFAVSYVAALSIGNSIHLNITIDNSTAPNDPSITNDTNPVITNNTTDTSQTNEDQTNTDTTSTLDDNTDDSSNSDSNSGIATLYGNSNDNSVSDPTNNNVVNQNSQKNSSLLSGASVFSGSGMSNTLKILSIIPTIFLAVVFICTYMLYRRKIDEESDEVSVKKRRKMIKNK